MNIYLAGSGWVKLWVKQDFYDFNRLESFYYIDEKEVELLDRYKSFILDSGAFTYLSNQKQATNWEQYVIKYGNFVKAKNINLFFELDIDPIVGIEEVERLRCLLENVTERKCIPVWHKSRGLEYWKQMCKDYDYVAIGGIVTKEIKRSEHNVFHPLLKIAKESDCKVHGLGYTNLKGLEKYKFHSVDSTSWLSGNRFGKIYLFNGKTMAITERKEQGLRVKSKKAALHNFSEWVKFSKYAEENL